MKYVDLRTGLRVDAPEEYDSNVTGEGQRLQIDNIEALRTAGESEDVLHTLTSVGAPSSYQAAPGEEVISVDDPEFPWHLLENAMPRIRSASGGEERIRTAKERIQSPPNVFTDDWWPFCYNGNPAGIKWNPPTSNGYNGQYYVKGNYGNVYLWNCGWWRANRSSGSAQWNCCGYAWMGWYPSWKQSDGPMKSWPKYTCK